MPGGGNRHYHFRPGSAEREDQSPCTSGCRGAGEADARHSRADEERRLEEKRTRSRRPGEYEDDDQGEGGYAAADCQTKVPARDSETGTSGAGGAQRKLRPRLGESVATSVPTCACWEPCNEKTKGKIKEIFIVYTEKQNCVEQILKCNKIQHTICH
ncbi:hypothetical protein NDU88_000089 [Pleurodeles waltl]|uniref:Uncharacterized protein n=1 Tax=Pleurodeles waltl TaxID=8319 RepID=A0AAV7VSG3_PLEWA|nr:hypothetical protein NDU88_000089 [Pleurodeles waltl]